MLIVDAAAYVTRTGPAARAGGEYSIEFAREFSSKKSKSEREAEKSGPGWVYVLKQPRDPYFSNLYFKVGLSKHDPDDRAIQLWDTAVTLPLHVKYAICAENRLHLEQAFYAFCSEIRLRADQAPKKNGKIPVKDREFVPLGLPQIIWILNHCADSNQLATGAHLIAKDAVADARRAIGVKLLDTGVVSECFNGDQPNNEIAAHARSFRLAALQSERDAFKKSRKWAGRVLAFGVPGALGCAALAFGLGGVHGIATGELAACGVAVAASASVIAGRIGWSRTVSPAMAASRPFGVELCRLIEGEGTRRRRAPLLIAVTGPDPRPALVRSPESRRRAEAERGEARHRRLIERLARTAQRKAVRLAEAERDRSWREEPQPLTGA